jgi:hypothetical protein
MQIILIVARVQDFATAPAPECRDTLARLTQDWKDTHRAPQDTH